MKRRRTRLVSITRRASVSVMLSLVGRFAGEAGGDPIGGRALCAAREKLFGREGLGECVGLQPQPQYPVRLRLARCLSWGVDSQFDEVATSRTGVRRPGAPGQRAGRFTKAVAVQSAVEEAGDPPGAA